MALSLMSPPSERTARLPAPPFIFDDKCVENAKGAAFRHEVIITPDGRVTGIGMGP
jgi:hypothetical protein